MSRVVAGTLLLPNGQPMANASIYFTAKRTEPVSIIEGSNTFFNTSAAGVYNQSVVNGFYAVSIQYIADASGAYTRRWQLGDVFIEDGATTTLEALIIASTVPDDIALGVFYEILEEAQQAAADAQAAAAAAAASAASISVGTGPTQIPNNTILNGRLGTTGNLGTAAQRAIGTAGANVSDNTQLNVRLGSSGNLGAAAVAGVTANATDETAGSLRRTQDSPGYSKANAWSGSNTFSLSVTANTFISSVASAAYDVDGAGGSGNSIPAGIAYHDGVGWVNLPLSDLVPVTVKVLNSRSFQVAFGATSGRAYFRGLHSTTSNSWREFYTTGNTSANVQSMLGAANNAAIRTAIDASVFPSYTVATVPVASANANKGIVVTNAASGRRPYWSNGTDWRDASNVPLS